MEAKQWRTRIMKIKMLGYLAICIVLIAAFTSSVYAATGADAVTVTVNYVDLLAVPATAALTLTTATAGATDYTQATLTQTNGLTYSHNSTAAKKISATAVQDSGGANNVTLTAGIAGGETAAAVVNAGTVQSGVLLWTGIGAGGYTKDIAWTADGTLAGTTAGNNINKDYAWTVTFTSADAS